MRAAIVTSDYFVMGETFINRHIEHLFGGDTCIVTGRANGQNPYDKPVFERRSKLSTTDRLRAPFAAIGGAIAHGTSRIPFGQNRAALIRFLKDQKVDVILSEFGTQALVVAQIGQDLNIPVFTYWRGTDASKALQSAQRVRSYKLMMPKLAGMFSVSQFLLDNLAAHGVTHPNAHVMPSGVNVRLFTPAQKRRGSFLAVGRMVEKKAPDVTLRAFADAARNTSAHLTFIGDGPLLEKCKTLADTLGIGQQVTFTGALPHDEVRTHLQRSEVFLQHSVTAKDGNTEGLPTAIQEALACGCVTVSTRHAGIPEAIAEGVNGFLVDEWDEDAYRGKIATVLDMASLDQMAQSARETAELKFDNDVLLRKTEHIIKTTV